MAMGSAVEAIMLTVVRSTCSSSTSEKAFNPVEMLTVAVFKPVQNSPDVAVFWIVSESTPVISGIEYATLGVSVMLV